MARNYKRLIVGGGRSRAVGDEYPSPRPGDLTLDLDHQAKPHLVGDIFHPPFKPESFDSVIFERFNYNVLLDSRPSGIEMAYRLLKPRGTLSILTGAVPLGNLLPDLEAWGFQVAILHEDNDWDFQTVYDRGEWRNVYGIYVSAIKEG